MTGDGGNDWRHLGAALAAASVLLALVAIAAFTLATWGIIELVQWIGCR